MFGLNSVSLPATGGYSLPMGAGSTVRACATAIRLIRRRKAEAGRTTAATLILRRSDFLIATELPANSPSDSAAPIAVEVDDSTRGNVIHTPRNRTAIPVAPSSSRPTILPTRTAMKARSVARPTAVGKPTTGESTAAVEYRKATWLQATS